VALHIYRQSVILILILARSLCQMHMHTALALRPFHIESELEMLGAPLVRLSRRREVPVARQSRPRAFAVRRNFVAGPEERLALRMRSDQVRSAVEVGGFGRG
jgi:hypothetical protein